MSAALCRRLGDILAADPARARALQAVAALAGGTFWIGAGFVRNAVWDFAHGNAPSLGDSDVDVVWFDPSDADVERDRRVEAILREQVATVAWSVKNQARMHLRNGDAPYASVKDAIARWPETATSVVVRLQAGRLKLLAPHGLTDLFALILRPTPSFAGDRYAVFEARVRDKRWLARWPKLLVASHEAKRVDCRD